MEQKQANNYDNLLLDNINTPLPIDITLSTTPKQLCNSTPSLLKNHQSEVLAKENSPINNFHITKIENYINKKYDQIALEYLKSQIVKEIKHEFTNNDTNDLNNRGSQKDASDVITELHAHIQTLESEVYFLREELKEKSFLLRSLITDKHNTNTCSKLPTTLEKPMSLSPISTNQTIPSNKNINFHTENDQKKKHISDVNEINHVKDNKPEKQTICANNDSSHTTPPPRKRTITTTTIATTVAAIFKKPSHPIHHQIHLKINHKINQLENGKKEQT